MSTLFGHLASRMTTRVENLATEGLLFVLKNSTEARRLMTDYLRQSGAVLPEGLDFRSQVADDDGAIPDLAGVTPGGTTAVLIEAKFWAGLTGHQPNTYLARLPPGGLLAFVAPAARMTPLWPELLRRAAGSAAYMPRTHSTVWRTAVAPDGRRLALTTWSALLNWLHTGLLIANESAAAADVAQLVGLAERMDETAFLPFTSEQLTGDAPRVICQMCQVVDRTVKELAATGIADVAGCRTAASGWGEYWSPFRSRGFHWALYFHPKDWLEWGCPIWLKVGCDYYKPAPVANTALMPLQHTVPPRFSVSSEDNFGYLRIDLPVNVELDAVVQSVVVQVTEAVTLVPQT